MNTRSLPHLPHLDGWRGLAIAFLLAGHFFPMRGIDLGEFGVHLFFVLSGYLMAGLLFVAEVPIPLFYKRRISRILPALIVYLLCVLAGYCVLGLEIDWNDWLAAALLVNNYLTQIGHETMPVGHIWSLSVEEHSYILLSLLAIAYRRKIVAASTSTALLGLASIACGIAYAHYGVQGRWTNSEIAAFGILAATFFRLALAERAPWRLPALSYPVLFLVALSLYWWIFPKPVHMFGAVALLALLVNLIGEAPGILRSVLSFPPLRQLGVWSFSIYLWQQPFFLLVSRHKLLNPWAGLAAAIVAGFVSYTLVEMPIRRTLNRVWAKT